jgi:hypothetical protein
MHYLINENDFLGVQNDEPEDYDESGEGFEVLNIKILNWSGGAKGPGHTPRAKTIKMVRHG